MRFNRLASLLFLATSTSASAGATTGCAASSSGSEPPTADSNLTGGTADLRWGASGYLASGPSAESINPSKAVCGATLIAPNVAVTAAHCILAEGVTFAFGTGDLGSDALVRVKERHVHPDFHAKPDGAVDLVNALRMHDVALLVLEKDVTNVKPADLSDEAPAVGCNVQAIGYHEASPGKALRASAPACVEFRVALGTDPIFEVHPAANSAVCVADGDEGGAVVVRDETHTKLVGIYVGSVTQGLTDCRRGTQFLDGYESMFGYRDFLLQGIAKARPR